MASEAALVEALSRVALRTRYELPEAATQTRRLGEEART
jgi:hypothetical protein